MDRDKAHRLRHERQRSRVLRRWVAAVTLLATGMFSAFVVATRRGRQVRAELARALRLEAVRSIGQQEYGRSLAYLAASLRQNPEDRATIVRTVSLLADQTFALPLAVRQPFHPMPRDRRYCPAEDDAPSWSGRRIDESDAISSDATRYAWQDRSRRGTYRASAQCGGRDTATFAPGFSDAPGTRWHAQFDDRGRWLAIMATRRNGTEVGLWSVADLAHPVPAIAPIAVPEAAGARLVVNGAQDTLRYMDVQDAGSEATADGGEPRTSTRWNVREGRYIPQWREAPAAWSRGLGSRGNVAALNAALSRQGWSVKGEPKDEAPLVLVSPEGREEPLDLAGWSNTWAMDATDDGRVLAIGGEDHALHLWRVDRRELTAGPPLPHDAAVWRAHLSAAGDLVVTATGSGGMETPQSIRVWDAVTGDLLAGPWPAIGQVEACAFVRGGAVVRCGVPSERAGGGWTVAEWPIGAPGVRADAAALAALAEAVGGWRLTSERALVLVPVARRVAVLDSLRRDHAGGRPTALREFVAWFLADRNTRHAADALPR